MTELVALNLGCGRKTDPALYHITTFVNGAKAEVPVRFLNLDAEPLPGVDLVVTLGRDPIPLPDDSVHLVLAMHVLEHIGRQGELEGWFHCWGELYRVLVPGGRVQFECPYWSSIWAWADPTHTRAISEQTFLYLDQNSYRTRGDMSAIPRYRPPCDFALASWEFVRDQNPEVAGREGDRSHCRGTLVARKPWRPYWADEDTSCGTS